MKLKRLLVIVWFVLSANFVVSTGFGALMPSCMNWNMLVAYDEEMVATGNSFPGFCFFSAGNPLSVQEYVKTQFQRATYRFEEEFGIQFWAVKYIQWESDDSLKTTQELLCDAIRKVGFTSGMWIDGSIVRGLIVWTDQKAEDYLTLDGWRSYGGGALPNERALIVNYQATWADDNVLQHELSHLFGAALDDHFGENHCVMDRNREHVDWYWESKEPISSGSALLYLGVYDSVPGGYIHNKWCDVCKQTIQAHKNFWDYNYPFVGDEGIMEGLPKPQYWRILIPIAEVMAVGVLGYAVARIIKHIRKRKTRVERLCGK